MPNLNPNEAETGFQRETAALPSSFRDPSGFMFRRDGRLFRQVNQIHQAEFDQFVSSGLYGDLVARGLLIPHEEVDAPPANPVIAYKILAPEVIPFISYPYEWSFSQLKDAALLTLDVQRLAIEHGMSLKDASAFNIQFHRGRPVFIDTLSFEPLRERPWTPYRQFTEQFLAPLALRSRSRLHLGTAIRPGLDGIPIELASQLLPRSTYLNPGLLMHVHLHAKTVARYNAKASQPLAKPKIPKFSKQTLIGLIESLASTVKGLNWSPSGTEWADYSSEHGYSAEAHAQKFQFVSRFLETHRPSSVWDLASNTGDFGRLAAERGIPTVAFDIDPACVERAYLRVREDRSEFLLPLQMDLTNPSPAIGWMGKERLSLLERAPAGASFALALIHHLAVSGNVPLGHAAAFFRATAPKLVIEFVPKSDPQFQRLMTVRDDIFNDYSQAAFEAEFRRFFRIERSERLADSERTMYEMTALD